MPKSKINLFLATSEDQCKGTVTNQIALAVLTPTDRLHGGPSAWRCSCWFTIHWVGPGDSEKESEKHGSEELQGQTYDWLVSFVTS